MQNKKEPARQFELSQLTNSSQSNVLDKQLSQGFNNPTVKGVTEHINTTGIQPIKSGADFTEQIAAKRAALQAAKTGGRKLMGAIPFLGAGYAALSGDPAMAAEQLGRDAIEAAPVALSAAAKLGAGATPVGMGMIAADAFMPEQAGNPEEERQMLAERNAQVDYQNSPAHLAKMKALQGIR